MASKDADRDPIWEEGERWQRDNGLDAWMFRQAVARQARVREAVRSPEPSAHTPDLIMQSLDSLSALFGGE